jgi:hypothetical protein
MKPLIRLAAALAVATGLLSCNLFDYSNIITHKYALVYGVTRYTFTVHAGSLNDPNLTYPDSDASAIASILHSEGYIGLQGELAGVICSRWVDDSGIVWNNGASTSQPIGSLVATSSDGSSASGQDTGDLLAPSKTNILQDIQNISSHIGPNDVLVVYFSGHGTQSASSPPREFFDPYGSVMYDGSTTAYWDYPYPSVRDDELRAAFDAVKTPRKVLILDTCNSGGFIGNQLESDWTPPLSGGGGYFVSPETLMEAISNYASMQSSPTGLSPYGAQVLSAAGRDELSYETPTWSHGVMTYWLLQGLQGKTADLNNDGHVTVLEAFAYAKAGVDQNWNAANPIASDGTSAAFEPHVSGGPVDFVLF